MNSLEWSGYYLFSGFSGLGDWGGTQDGLFGVRPQWAWRVALSAAGTALYLLTSLLNLRVHYHVVIGCGLLTGRYLGPALATIVDPTEYIRATVVFST